MASRSLQFVLAAVLLAASAQAVACRCVEPASTSRAYRTAPSVVLASVQSVEGVGDAPGGARATLRISEAWKTAMPPTVDVRTSTTCAFDFRPGTEYLLYLRRGEQAGEWTTRICLGNRPSADAGEALDWLRRHGQRAPVRTPR